MVAVREGHYEVAEILVKQIPPIIRPRVLALSVEYSNLQMAEMLLNMGFALGFRQEDIPEYSEEEDSDGRIQPLLLAVIKRGLGCGQLLLDKGANANLRCEVVPSWKFITPYHYVLLWAVESGHESWRGERKDSPEYQGNPEIVTLLLVSGADPNHVHTR
jgi:hypothetical protein